MAVVKTIAIRLFTTGAEDAKAKIDRVDASAAELRRLLGEKYKVDIDATAAMTKLALLRSEFRRAAMATPAAGGGGWFKNLLGKAGTGAAGAGGTGLLGITATLPLVGTLGIPALAGLAVAAAAAALALAPVAAALIPITIGFAGFALVALPMLSGLTTALTGVSTATNAYAAASQNLNIAIHKSPADMKAYKATIHGLEPDLQNAARLLTNQNVVWQNLSPSMQKSVIALANNKAALRGLLPDQQKALTALLAEKTAWDQLTPAQKTINSQMTGLKDQFSKLRTAVQPEVIKAFGQGLRIVKELMPALGPLVKAAASAFADLLKHLADWLASPSGKSFVNWLKTVGPKDIKNFGRVLWDVAHSVGDALHWIYSVGSWIDKFVTHWYQDWVLVKDIAQLQWDQIKVAALTLVFDILGAFTHIPFIGGAFRQARRDIAIELGRIVDDSRRAINEMQAAWDALHGKKVSIEFTTAFVASHGVHVLPAATNAKGTPGAAPGWSWVGELGPELIKLKGGEQIIPSHIARGYAGGAGWNIYDFFDPRVAAAMKRVGAGVNAAENAGAAYVQAHPLSYWKFSRFGGIAGPGGGAPGMNAALAQLMYGNIMGRGDWPAWNYVAMRESGWNQFATNASSGAYGIPQALPFSKMPRAAWPGWAGGSSNPAAQISWMWNYMRGVYGGPQGAAAHEAAFNWYDRGGYLPPGLSLAYNGTGRPERVGGAATYIINISPAPLARPADIGREVVTVIREFEKRSGKGWRS